MEFGFKRGPIGMTIWDTTEQFTFKTHKGSSEVIEVGPQQLSSPLPQIQLCDFNSD